MAKRSQALSMMTGARLAQPTNSRAQQQALIAVVIGQSLLYGDIIHMPHLGCNGGAVAYGGELGGGGGKALLAVGELCPRVAQARRLPFKEA
jgi:hypothetical protein